MIEKVTTGELKDCSYKKKTFVKIDALENGIQKFLIVQFVHH